MIGHVVPRSLPSSFFSSQVAHADPSSGKRLLGTKRKKEEGGGLGLLFACREREEEKSLRV